MSLDVSVSHQAAHIQCQICNASFPRMQLSDHVESCHVGPVEQLYRIICGSCDYSVANYQVQLMMEHCFSTSHESGNVDTDWNTYFREQESRRVSRILKTGIQILCSSDGIGDRNLSDLSELSVQMERTPIRKTNRIFPEPILAKSRPKRRRTKIQREPDPSEPEGVEVLEERCRKQFWKVSRTPQREVDCTQSFGNQGASNGVQLGLPYGRSSLGCLSELESQEPIESTTEIIDGLKAENVGEVLQPHEPSESSGSNLRPKAIEERSPLEKCNYCDKTLLIVDPPKRNQVLLEHGWRHLDFSMFKCETCGMEFRWIQATKKHFVGRRAIDAGCTEVKNLQTPEKVAKVLELLNKCFLHIPWTTIVGGKVKMGVQF